MMTSTGTDVFEVFRALKDGAPVEITRLYPGFRGDHAVRDAVRVAMQRFVDAKPREVIPRSEQVDDDVWLLQGWSSRAVGVGALVQRMRTQQVPLDLQLVADVVVPVCEALECVGGQTQVQPRAVVVDLDGAVRLWCAEQIARPGRTALAPNLSSSLADLMVLLLGGRAGSSVADVAPPWLEALGPVVDACRSDDPPSAREIGDALRERVADVDLLGPQNMSELVRVLFSPQGA